MKIKDAEKLTGIPSANIRYYEKEGLLHPARNTVNNYREYDRDTIERLNQIKILRALGIPLDDIKQIILKERSVESVIQDRLKLLREEEMQLVQVRNACERILREGTTLELLNESVLEGSKENWKKRMEEIFTSEMTAVDLSVRQMNRHISVLLILGLILQMFFAFMFRKWVLENLMTSEFAELALGVAVLILVSASIATYWSGSIKVHAIILVLVSAFWPSLFQMVIWSITCVSDPCLCQTLIGGILPVQAFLILFIICVWKIGEKKMTWCKKEWHMILLSAVTSVIFGVILKWMEGEVLPVWIMALAGSFYIGIYWAAIVKDVVFYNRYYAVASANRLLNPIAVIFHYRGRHSTTLWK